MPHRSVLLHRHSWKLPLYSLTVQSGGALCKKQPSQGKHERRDQPQADVSKCCEVKGKCWPLGFLSFFSDLVSGIVSFLPSQRVSYTKVWPGQIAERQDTPFNLNEDQLSGRTGELKADFIKQSCTFCNRYLTKLPSVIETIRIVSFLLILKLPSPEGGAHRREINSSHGNPVTDWPIKVIAAAEIFRAIGEVIGGPDIGVFIALILLVQSTTQQEGEWYEGNDFLVCLYNIH